MSPSTQETPGVHVLIEQGGWVVLGGVCDGLPLDVEDFLKNIYIVFLFPVDSNFKFNMGQGFF